MIYDAFPFFNELDILELRLRETEGVVDRWILAEAPVTFSGHLKPLYYAENKDRYDRWNDRITHLVINDMPAGDDPWSRDRFQREALRRGMGNVKATDTVILADVDEIPSAATLRDIYRYGFPEILAMHMKNYYYYFNFRFRWDMYFAKVLSGNVIIRGDPFQELRFRMMLQDNILRDAGWHFTYMGGMEKVKLKIKSTAHCKDPLVPVVLEKYEMMEPIVAEEALLTRTKITPTDYPKDVIARYEWWKQKGYIHD